jgi:hypothetical protein
MVVKNKAIQELFDPTYGRMNATLGVELPFTSALVQTTIPLGYVDPATELLKNGETQIWKITHNGVDAHPIHFHLFNVQLVNRIGWDGTVKVPADNERGWKETIRFNPLEDLVVALRPKTPTLGGFGLPTSSRPMDPSQPLGVPTGFTQVDTVTGNPATVVNDTVNYGWEYVWHCHILGHEENDFMRPVVFDAAEATPPAPTMAVPAPTYSATNGVALSWADNATTEYKYTVTRSPVAFPNQPDGTTTVSLLANATGYTDTTIDLTKGASSYTYTVTAVGANMDPKIQSSASTTVTMPVPPTAPSSASISSNSVQGTAQAATATLTFRDRSNNETSFVIQSSTGTINNSTVWTSSAPIISTTSASTFQTISTTVSLTTGVVNNFRVVAVNAAGLSVPSNTATVDMSVPTTAGTVNTAVQGTVGNYRNLVLNWSSPTNGTNPNGTTYAVVANGNQLNGNLRNGINTFNNFFPATGVTNYTIQVVATRTVGAVDLTATSNTVSYTPTIYGASVNGVSTVTSAPGSRTITVNWTATPATNGATTRYDVQRATSLNNNANWTTISGNGVNGLTFNATGLTSGTTYYFRVRANSGNPLNSTSPYVTTSAGTKAP